MKTIFTIIFLTLIFPRTFLTQNLIWNSLYNSYENFKEPNIFDKRISHSYLSKSIKKIEKSDLFTLEVAGKSLEGRKIFHISTGEGKVNVLLWSQMHGDEPTATMALLDILNFLSADDDFNQLRKSILENLSIHIIPMLNPDGAEQFSRRNALHVDLNRDALRLQFPESKILKSVRDSINAEFAPRERLRGRVTLLLERWSAVPARWVCLRLPAQGGRFRRGFLYPLGGMAALQRESGDGGRSGRDPLDHPAGRGSRPDHSTGRRAHRRGTELFGAE